MLRIPAYIQFTANSDYAVFANKTIWRMWLSSYNITRINFLIAVCYIITHRIIAGMRSLGIDNFFAAHDSDNFIKR